MQGILSRAGDVHARLLWGDSPRELAEGAADELERILAEAEREAPVTGEYRHVGGMLTCDASYDARDALIAFLAAALPELDRLAAETVTQ